jgi:hypothetical protein
MFSPGIFWSGLIVNLSGCEVQALQTNSYGVTPRSVLRRLAKAMANRLTKKTVAHPWCYRRSRSLNTRGDGGEHI